MRKKIAFLQIGAFSSINQSVLPVLAQHFPDLDIEIIDVAQMVKTDKQAALINLLPLGKAYGIDILRRKRRLWNCFFRTEYMFRYIQRVIRQRITPEQYAWTFQMQSMFDGSVPGLPHYVYTDHTHLANLYYPDYNRKNLYKPTWIRLEREIYHNATLNFTMSSHISRSMREQYGVDAERIVCVYAGSNAVADQTIAAQHDYSNKHIVFVGIDWERKGGPELIEAFKLVLAAHPDAQLTIVGCSPQVDVKNVRVVGRVPLTEVSQYYHRAAVFCLPTKVEPFGIAFIEALNHRLPVVATNIGAAPDIVLDGENGYVVEPGNIRQLADALITLLGDPQRCKAFAERGFAIAAERYTWPKVGQCLHKHIVASMGHPLELAMA